MSSIVIDLQNEITLSECDVVKVLRRAHVIAVKLGLQEYLEALSCSGCIRGVMRYNQRKEEYHAIY